MKLALLCIAIFISSALAFSIGSVKEFNKIIPKVRYKHDCAHRSDWEKRCIHKNVPTAWKKEAHPKLGYSPRTGGPLVTTDPNPPASKGGHHKRRFYERALAMREPAHPENDEPVVRSYFRRKDQHDNADARDWKKLWRWFLNGGKYTPSEDALKRPEKETESRLPSGLDYGHHPYNDDSDIRVDLTTEEM
ncbi:hypothetical protein BP6252_11700 [Coleophoma cylindrospora]|uniref:Uncharacterized protein n=1 Tax=Coleophoma cylindrospora TaxID=1849047 RepID=A0A3D8QKJ7_9HELO|nr:hypothetical protein BP6252_11700 [Coleophoma cylindrospora]